MLTCRTKVRLWTNKPRGARYAKYHCRIVLRGLCISWPTINGNWQRGSGSSLTATREWPECSNCPHDTPSQPYAGPLCYYRVPLFGQEPGAVFFGREIPIPVGSTSAFSTAPALVGIMPRTCPGGLFVLRESDSEKQTDLREESIDRSETSA